LESRTNSHQKVNFERMVYTIISLKEVDIL